MCSCLETLFKWCIYLTSLVVVGMSVYILITDVHETGVQNVSVWPSVGIAGLMFASGSCGLLHLYSPRLIFIALMVLLGAVYLVARFPFAPGKYHAELLWVLLLNSLLGCCYFYCVAFYDDHDPNQTSWITLTSSSAASSVPSSVPTAKPSSTFDEPEPPPPPPPKSTKRKKNKKKVNR